MFASVYLPSESSTSATMSTMLVWQQLFFVSAFVTPIRKATLTIFRGDHSDPANPIGLRMVRDWTAGIPQSGKDRSISTVSGCFRAHPTVIWERPWDEVQRHCFILCFTTSLSTTLGLYPYRSRSGHPPPYCRRRRW